MSTIAAVPQSVPNVSADTTTDERLLATAEHLFAQHGIAAVSVRSITIAAAANIAAVHYHFGTKFDIVRALVERRVDEVNGARLVLLRTLEQAAEVSAHDVATVWIEPLARLAIDPERMAYLGFVVALSNAEPAMRSLAGDVYRRHFSRLDAALTRALPHLDAPVRRFRFGLAVDMSMRALAKLSELDAPWLAAAHEIDADGLVSEITDAFAGVLAGATSHPAARSTRRTTAARTTRSARLRA